MKSALPVAFAVALLAGSATAWSPRYWSAGIAVAGVCLVAAAWAIVTRTIDYSPQLIAFWLMVGAISGWGALQLLTHVSIAPWLTTRASMFWLACGLSFFLASQVADRAFLACLLWGTTILAVAALLHKNSEPAGFGTFLYKNHFAAMIEMVAPIALWLGLGGAPAGRPTPGRIACPTFAILFAAVVASSSRAGVALLLAELLIVIAMRSRRNLRLRTAGVSIGLLGAAAWIAGPERIREHFNEKDPWSVRGQLLESTIRMTGERPWMGFGMGTWRAVYPAFATFDAGLVANEAHNDWIEWAAEGGVPIAALMAFLTLWLARPAVQSVWGLGVLAVMVHSLIDYPIREPATGLMWFSLAGALSRFADRREPPNPLFVR